MTQSKINEGEVLQEREVKTISGERRLVWLISDEDGYHVVLVNPRNNYDVREEWNYDTLAEAQSGVAEMLAWVPEAV